jgi:two-component system OmpR family response regulator
LSEILIRGTKVDNYMKILLIDDNEEITDLLQTTFAAKGYPCQVSNDGKEGLELIKKKKHDIVLLDLAIPRFSGEDILEELLQAGPIEDYNIFVFTASVISENEMDEFVKKGVLGCIRKPVRLDELLDTLQKHQTRN